MGNGHAVGNHVAFFTHEHADQRGDVAGDGDVEYEPVVFAKSRIIRNDTPWVGRI